MFFWGFFFTSIGFHGFNTDNIILTDSILDKKNVKIVFNENWINLINIEEEDDKDGLYFIGSDFKNIYATLNRYKFNFQSICLNWTNKFLIYNSSTTFIITDSCQIVNQSKLSNDIIINFYNRQCYLKKIKALYLKKYFVEYVCRFNKKELKTESFYVKDRILPPQYDPNKRRIYIVFDKFRSYIQKSTGLIKYGSLSRTALFNLFHEPFDISTLAFLFCYNDHKYVVPYLTLKNFRVLRRNSRVVLNKLSAALYFGYIAYEEKHELRCFFEV